MQYNAYFIKNINFTCCSMQSSWNSLNTIFSKMFWNCWFKRKQIEIHFHLLRLNSQFFDVFLLVLTLLYFHSTKCSLRQITNVVLSAFLECINWIYSEKKYFDRLVTTNQKQIFWSVSNNKSKTNNLENVQASWQQTTIYMP